MPPVGRVQVVQHAVMEQGLGIGQAAPSDGPIAPNILMGSCDLKVGDPFVKAPEFPARAAQVTAPALVAANPQDVSTFSQNTAITRYGPFMATHSVSSLIGKTMLKS